MSVEGLLHNCIIVIIIICTVLLIMNGFYQVFLVSDFGMKISIESIHVYSCFIFLGMCFKIVIEYI